MGSVIINQLYPLLIKSTQFKQQYQLIPGSCPSVYCWSRCPAIWISSQDCRSLGSYFRFIFYFFSYSISNGRGRPCVSGSLLVKKRQKKEKIEKYRRGQWPFLLVKSMTFCTARPPIEPTADTVPKPIVLICSGQISITQMNSTPQQQDTQYLAQKISISLAMSLKQVVHPGELLINPATRLHMPAMRKHLSPICLRLAVAMKKQAMGQATISDMLRMIWSTKMSTWNLSMAELGPMQSALSRNSRQARLIVLFLRDLYLKRCFMVKLLRQFYCCSCYFFSYITLITYYSVTWHSKPLISAILLRLFSTAALPFLQRQLGVSSRQSTISSSSMKAGSVQKKVVTCLQSLSQQQAIDTKTPATPNEHCSISEYFCLRWQSTIQFKMAMLMRMLDSQPAPASSKPTLAMNMFLLRLMSTKPATAVDQVRISPNLRPKLSEKCMNTMYPINTPKKRVILYVAMLDTFWQ